MDYQKIGAFIASLRKEQGLTQLELAEKLHLSDKAVSKWERGAGLPDISVLPLLSGVFFVSINELLAGERIITMDKEKNDEILTGSVGHYRKQSLIKSSIIFAGIAFVIIAASWVFFFMKLPISPVSIKVENVWQHSEGFEIIEFSNPNYSAVDIASKAGTYEIRCYYTLYKFFSMRSAEASNTGYVSYCISLNAEGMPVVLKGNSADQPVVIWNGSSPLPPAPEEIEDLFSDQIAA